jgi:hypothetical protein
MATLHGRITNRTHRVITRIRARPRQSKVTNNRGVYVAASAKGPPRISAAATRHHAAKSFRLESRQFFLFPSPPFGRKHFKKTFSSRVIGHTSMVRTRLPVTTRLRKLLIIERQMRESEGKTQGAIASEAKRLKFSPDQKLEFDVEKLPDKVANCYENP